MKSRHLITVPNFTRDYCIPETAQNSHSTLNHTFYTKFYMVHCKCPKVLSDHEPVQAMPLKECSNYSLPNALDISDGCETEGEPVCSAGEESPLEEEESSGNSDVALGPHSTTGRHQHFISAERIMFLKEKEEEYIATQSC